MKLGWLKPRSRQGFTLIELLIVIAILGVLAIAVLAAINPLEQLRKGRDTARLADARSILNAVEQFQASYGCYPWQYTTSGTCSSTQGANAYQNPTPINSTFMTNPGNLGNLIIKEELKSQFSSRNSIKNIELFIFKEQATKQVSVCFTPESQSARGGGSGPVVTKRNVIPGTCGTSYNRIDQNCAICVPQ